MISVFRLPGRTPLLRGLIALALLTGFSGCETDSEAPTVTIGAVPRQSAAARQAASAEEGNQVEDSQGAESAEAAAPSAFAPTQLPEGTQEQQDKMNLARAAFLSDRYEIAEGLFAELAREEPVTGTTVSAAIALAQIFIETNRPQQALALLTEVREVAQDVPEVLLVIARVYRQLGQPAEALRTFDRVLLVQPNYIFVYTEMAQIFYEEEDPERAQHLLLRYEQQIESLARALEDPEEFSEEERIYLVDIFAMVHDERGHQALIKALDDPSPEIRARAAQALGDLGVQEAQEALERLAVEDSSEYVRPVARQALLSLNQMAR